MRLSFFQLETKAAKLFACYVAISHLALIPFGRKKWISRSLFRINIIIHYVICLSHGSWATATAFIQWASQVKYSVNKQKRKRGIHQQVKSFWLRSWIILSRPFGLLVVQWAGRLGTTSHQFCVCLAFYGQKRIKCLSVGCLATGKIPIVLGSPGIGGCYAISGGGSSGNNNNRSLLIHFQWTTLLIAH